MSNIDYKQHFINRAKQVHNGKYSYDKVIYTRNSINVTITCPIHGDFQQAPSNHTSGKGCRLCANTSRASKRTKTLQQFIDQATEKHGSKYGYDKVIYQGDRVNVTIFCNGCQQDFNQKPNYHIRGHGCTHCNMNVKKTAQMFIKDAQVVHGDKYNYDKLVYINTDSKVDIICPKEGHGLFRQKALHHLQGHGCKKCVLYGPTRITTEDFIQRAQDVHGNNKYNYGNTIFMGTGIKVHIGCSEHGEFLQLPYNHLRGFGCSRCHASRLEERADAIMKNYNYTYTVQYSLPIMHRLRYDIYFEINGTPVIIELDGQQHFKYDAFFSDDKETYKRSRQLDMLKTIVPLMEGYKVIRIPYTCYNKLDDVITHCLELIKDCNLVLYDYGKANYDYIRNGVIRNSIATQRCSTIFKSNNDIDVELQIRTYG